MRGLIRPVAHLLLPAVLLAAALLARPYLQALSPGLLTVARLAPLVLLAAGLALALRFNRSRVFFSLTALLLSYGLTLWFDVPLHDYGSGLLGAALYAGLCVFLPLDLAIFALLTERGVFTPHGATRFALMGVEALFVWAVIALPLPSVLLAAYTQFTDHPSLIWTPIPQVAVFVILAAALVFNDRLFARPGAQRSALFGALVAVVVALHAIDSPVTIVACFSAAALMLIVAVVQESYSMAYIDELTALPGRRALHEQLLKLGSRYAIAMVDVDHFKKFNDRHGHDVGDQVLRMVAARLKEVGGGGRAFRYGGEEFTVVFPGGDAAAAVAPLEALRDAIAESHFDLRRKERRHEPRPEGKERRSRNGKAKGRGKGRRVSVTVSIGLAERDEKNVQPQQVIKAADRALYRAKKQGRDRLVS